jgi:hypothetical protein
VSLESREPTSRHAVTALVWAVLGWSFFPVFGWILAFIYAGRADRAIRRNPDLGGAEIAGSARSLARAGIAYILVVLAVIVGVWIAFEMELQDLAGRA